MSFWSFVGSTEEIPGTSGSGHTTVVAHLSHRFSPSLSYIVHRHIIIFNSWKHLKDLDFFFFFLHFSESFSLKNLDKKFQELKLILKTVTLFYIFLDTNKEQAFIIQFFPISEVSLSILLWLVSIQKFIV